MNIIEEESADGSSEEQSSWLTPYGTLMTILMVFFLILYAWNFYVTNAAVERNIGKKQDELAEKLKDYATVHIDRNEIKLQLAEAVLFDIGDATLKSGAKIGLSKIAEVLKENNNPIVVKGHTDNYPIVQGKKYRSNWHLSCARAFSVIRHLIEKEDIPPRRISAFGYAEYEPIAPFDTVANRTKNRRIEISLLQEEVLK
jgi:chemotaxis protein MotB